ncbi:unnamed protein product, partial [Candidula unifasciata]
VASIGMAIWSLTAQYGSEKMTHLTDSDIFRLLSILAIAGGVSNLIIGIFGFRCILAEEKRFMISV